MIISTGKPGRGGGGEPRAKGVNAVGGEKLTIPKHLPHMPRSAEHLCAWGTDEGAKLARGDIAVRTRALGWLTTVTTSPEGLRRCRVAPRAVTAALGASGVGGAWVGHGSDVDVVWRMWVFPMADVGVALTGRS